MNPDAVAPAAPAIDVTKTHLVREHKHEAPIISCRFDPSGKFILFGSEDYQVWRWEWSGDQKAALNHGAWVRGIACDPQGELVVSAGYDGRLVWWPLAGEAPQPIRSVEAHQGWANAAAISPDGQLLASCGNDRHVKLWRLADGSLLRELSGHESHVYNVAFHPDGRSLVSGDLKGVLIHWNVDTGEQVRQLKAESLWKFDGGFQADIGGFRGLTFNADGSQLAGSGITNVTNAFAGVGNPAVVVLDWQTGELTIQHESKEKVQGVAWGVAFHPAPLVIAASGGSGGFLLFWKPDEKENFHQVKLPDTARDLHLAPDGLHVATAHYDRHVRVYKLAE